MVRDVSELWADLILERAGVTITDNFPISSAAGVDVATAELLADCSYLQNRKNNCSYLYLYKSKQLIQVVISSENKLGIGGINICKSNHRQNTEIDKLSA